MSAVVVVFAGPTIGAKEIHAVLDATVLPPAGQGDIFRAARQGATVIGLIDGYFEGVPSVWHKEILWALEQGIAVFGSASMGALRAAELSAFGMVGVGKIFEAYASGVISDDDEVAVLHSPAELGFAPLSEPMVSIRATVDHAVSFAVLNTEQAASVLAAAKTLFYQHRTWRRVLADIPAAPWLDRFSAWLETGQVDAKREDAREMLTWMATFLNGKDQAAGTAAEPMERTLAWNGLVRRVEAHERRLQNPDRRVLDELRLDPERFGLFRTRAALRLLVLKEARRAGASAARQETLTQLNSHRQAHKLFRSTDLQNWLQKNGLTAEEYEARLEEAALAGAVLSAQQEDLEQHMLAELRQTGAFAALNARASDKEVQISALRQPDRPKRDTDSLQLAVWYFETCLDQDVPDDLGAYAGSIGLNNTAEFFELIRREFMYYQQCDTQSAGESRD